MTLPALLSAARFVHISERESDGSWEDCTWDSGLEWYRLCFDPSKPATHAEAQALRAASGEPSTGGSNANDLRRGIRARYGVIVPVAISGFTALREALKPNFAATVQGSMSAFGSTHRLSKWQANFDDGHQVLVVNIGGTLYWCDPLAPPGSTAVPVTVTWAEVADYVNSFGGTHLVGQLWNTPKEDTMQTLTSYLPGYGALIKPASNIRSAPDVVATTLIRKTGAEPELVILVGTVVGDVDPVNGSNVWYTWFKAGKWEFTAKDNVTNVKATATDDGITQATVDAAVAAQKTADAALLLAAVNKAIAETKQAILARAVSNLRTDLGL